MARSRGGSASSRTGEGVVPPQPTRPPPPVPPIPAEHRQPPQLPGARPEDARAPAAAAAATGATEAAGAAAAPGPPRGPSYSLFPPPFFPPPTRPLPAVPRGRLASAASLASAGSMGSAAPATGPPQLRKCLPSLRLHLPPNQSTNTPIQSGRATWSRAARTATPPRQPSVSTLKPS